jgi:hypothetical protein
MRVRRLLAGELLGAERERAEEHLADCGRCQGVRAELAREREELARALPFERFAAGVAERMAEPRPRAWRRALPLALAAGLAVAVALPAALLLGRDADVSGVRTKGAAGLALYAQGSGEPRLLGPDEPVPAGVRLRPALAPGRWRHAAVALVDADGAAVLYAGPARVGPLPEAFEWTGAVAQGTLVLVLSDAPVDARALEASLLRGVVLGPPGAASEVVTRPLRREASR